MTTETSLPLEELQEMGDRYSPRVLREYFLHNGYGHVRRPVDDMVLPEIKLLSLEELLRVRQLLVAGILSCQIGLVVGVVLFAFFSVEVWKRILDPVDQPSVVAAAAPGWFASTVLMAGLLASFWMEFSAAVKLAGVWEEMLLQKKKFIRFFSLAVAAALGRVAVVVDVLALVIIGQTSGGLLFMGSSMGLLLLLLTVGVQFALVVGLIRNRGGGALPTPLLPGGGTSTTSNSDYLEIPPNHTLLSQVIRAAHLAHFRLLSAILMEQCCPLPLQAELVLGASVTSFASCLGIHLLLLPVKVFFLLDFGPNPIVWLSAVLPLFLSTAFACINS